MMSSSCCVKYLILLTLIAVGATSQAELLGRSRYNYRSGSQQSYQSPNIDPEGRYRTRQGVEASANSDVRHTGTGTQAQHGYQVNGGYDVSRDGRSVQGGQTYYRGGSNNYTPHNGNPYAVANAGAAERNNAMANRDTAARLKTISEKSGEAARRDEQENRGRPGNCRQDESEY